MPSIRSVCRTAIVVSFIFISSPGFSQAFFMNGDATYAGNGCFDITPDLPDKNGSLWMINKIDLNSPFSLNFEIDFGSKDINGGQGVTFVLQSRGIRTMGKGGNGMGYKDLAPSFGIEFDTYIDLLNGDPQFGNVDHIAFHKNGNVYHYASTNLAGPVPAHPLTNNIEDGNFHDVQVTWDPINDTLKVYFDGYLRISKHVDLISNVFASVSEVWFGFTASTNINYNRQRVCMKDLNFTPVPSNVSICYGDTVRVVIPAGNNFNWTPNYNISSTTVSNPQFYPLLDTTYTVTFTDTLGNFQSVILPFVVNPAPNIYILYAPFGNHYCKGGAGVDISLTGSQTGTYYDLLLNGSVYWPDVSGNGGGISFGLQQPSGVYTAIAEDSITHCTANMYGNVTVVIDSLPIPYDVLGTGSFCQGSPGLEVTLNGSEPNVQYRLFRNGFNTGISVMGTGMPVSFGFQLVAATYTVYAINMISLCHSWMSGVATITMVPPPTVNIPALPQLCVDDSAIILPTGTPLGGTFSGPGVSNGVFDPAIGPGMYMITYSYLDTIIDCLGEDSTAILVNGLPFPDLGQDTSICDGDNIIFIPVGAYTNYQWSTGSVNQSVSTDTAGTYMVTVSDIHGCIGADTVLLGIDSLPVVDFTITHSVCDGAPPFALTGGMPLGGTYSGTGVAGGMFDPQTGPGSYQVLYSYTDLSTQCSNVAIDSMTVYALPNVLHNAFPGLCFSDPPLVLTGGSPVGGTYSGTGVVNGIFDPSYGTGTFQVQYTYLDTLTSCASDTFIPLTVYPLPQVTLGSFADVCVNGSAFALSGGNPVGGTYTGTGISNGIFYPATGPGIYIVRYIYQDSLSGCIDSASSSIQVHALPLVFLDSIQEFCVDDPSYALTTGHPFGGVYAGTGIAGGLFLPFTGAGQYPYVYNYQDPATLCSNQAYDTITVHALPVVSLAFIPDVCIDEPPFNIGGGIPAGGIYTINSIVVNIFDPASGSGSYTLEYFYTDSISGCSNRDSVIFIVHPLPVVGLQSFQTLCASDSPLLLTGGTPVGGTYTGTGVSGGYFDPATGPGSYSIQYQYMDTTTFCSDSVQEVIIVHPLPVLSLVSFPDVCISDSPFPLSGGIPTGGTYSGTGVTAGVFYPSTGAGDYHISYSYTDTLTGCTDSISDTIHVNPLPVIAIAGYGPYCEDDTVVLLSGSTPVGGTYSGQNVVNGSFDPSTGPGGYNVIYSYTDTITSCSNTDTTNVLVYPLPIVGVSPFPDLCFSDAAIVLNQGIPAGGTYSGSGITGIMFDPAISGPGTFAIRYAYLDNFTNCLNFAEDSITVHPLPPLSLSLGQVFCVNDPSILLNGGLPPGGTYSGPGVIAGIFSPAAGAGSYIVTYTYQDMLTTCVDSAQDTITVNPLPVVSHGPYSTMCVDDSSLVLNTGNPAGGVYTGAGVTGNIFDPATGPGLYYIIYHYTDSVTLCTNISIDSILVYPLPIMNIGNLPDFCEDEPVTLLSSGIPSGGTYSGPGVTSNNFDPSTGPGNYSILYSYTHTSSGCTNTDTGDLVVYALPPVTINSTLEFCVDEPAFTLNSGSPSGGLYSGSSISGGIFNPSSGPGTFYYQYSYTDIASGCENIAYDSIIVHALPVIQFPVLPDICIDTLPIMLPPSLPSGGTYTGPGISGNVFNPSLPGTYTIVYTFADSVSTCSNSDQQDIMVFPLPAPVLPYDTAFCEGESISLNAGPGYNSYIWSNASTSQVTIISAVDTITLTVEDNNGCWSIPVSTIVDVHPKPVLSIGNDTSVCYGNTVVFDAGPGFLYYYWQDGSGQQYHHASTSGKYWCEVGDYNNCFARDSVYLQILPIPYVNLGDSVFMCNEDFVKLDASQVHGSYTYTWQDGSGQSFYMASEPGMYWVIVDNDACSASDTIVVLECASIWVPTAFTPNNDGVNDLFFASTSEELVQFRMFIYNRWGQLVYETENINERWDGTFKGQPCAQDVYTWIIYFDRRANVVLEQQGTSRGQVTLIR